MSRKRPSAERTHTAIGAALRHRHGDDWRDCARAQHSIATRAAADFKAAGDPGMAGMLRRHAEHLAALIGDPAPPNEQPDTP